MRREPRKRSKRGKGIIIAVPKTNPNFHLKTYFKERPVDPWRIRGAISKAHGTCPQRLRERELIRQQVRESLTLTRTVHKFDKHD